MRAFDTITSTAGMRPPPTRGRSRWLTTPRSTPASIETTCDCFSCGKNSTMRPMVSAASSVCSVEKTRCPDSAACNATCAVSASRSSPMRMTSGSCRRTRRSACAKLSVSIPDLALVHDAAAIVVEDLDRVLDRDDVLLTCAIDLVDHRRERCRLSGAGGAGDEHEATLLPREPRDSGREVELVEAGDPVRDHAKGERDGAALAESVHAEARKVGTRVRKIEVATLVEELASRGHRRGDLVEHGLELGVVELAEIGEVDELAVLAHAPVAARPSGGRRWHRPRRRAEGRRLRSIGHSCIGTSRAALEVRPRGLRDAPGARARGAAGARAVALRSGARGRRGGDPRLHRRRRVLEAPRGRRADSDRPQRFAFHDAAACRSSAAESAGSYCVRTPLDDRVGCEPRGDERLVHAVSRQRIDEARRVTDEENAAPRRRRRRARASGAGGRERRRARDGIDAVSAREPVEMGAQVRTLGHPPADAEVRVIALREHPAVPAGHDPELDPGRPVVARCGRARSTERSPRARRRGRCLRRARPPARRHRWRRRPRRGTTRRRAATRRRAPSRRRRRARRRSDGDSVAEVGARRPPPARRDGGRAGAAGSSR